MKALTASTAGMICGLALVFGWLGAAAEEKPRSPHWPKVRAEHLQKHPACAACGTTDNLQVHHVEPFHVHPGLELEETNLITLCEKPGHMCHFVFGHSLNWKCWNPDVRHDAARQLKRVKERKGG